MVLIVEGDLLDAKTDFIGHQCNCVTKTSLGLATEIFKKFPCANTYAKRKSPTEPGTILISSMDFKQFIVNMYAQYKPGKNNDMEPRLKWFEMCLEQLAHRIGKDTMTLGLPYLIGCGLAGGNWDEYQTSIKKFEDAHPNILVTLYKKS